MIRKYNLWVITGMIFFFFISAFPINTKGQEIDESMWNITLKGKGEEPFFQSSVTMEVDLKSGSTKDDVMIFVNKQKWEGNWDYDQNLKMVFREEGNYEIHLIHKNGYEEIRKITIELNNPTSAKINTGVYGPGTWSNQDIFIKAYGSNSVSKVAYYQYKIGDDQWKIMKNDQLEIKNNLDEQILIRPVSRAGREGNISKVWCRLWKKTPKIPDIYCDQRSNDGWYQKIPEFSYKVQQTDGPKIHIYAKLTQVETKQVQTEIDQIPVIKQDGKYQWKIWAQDEAGNKSNEVFKTMCFVDTKKPEIFIQYEKEQSYLKALKYQKAKIKIKDQNLLKRSLKIKTSGKQIAAWKQEGDFYQTEVIFDTDGKQNLWIQAQDMAGNIVEKEESTFQIDTQKPQIEIHGITNEKSYNRPVNISVRINDKNLDKTQIYLNRQKWLGGKISMDGYYKIEVQAQDFAGNKNSAVKRFTVNQRGIGIQFLQKNLREANVSTKNLKPGFQITSLEPVQVTEFLVNGQKVAYQWIEDKVYVKDPIIDNGRCTISMSVKDANGKKCSSEKVTFFYDTKKPVIKMKGLDKNYESVYGTEILLFLENDKDHWTKIMLDDQKIKHSGNKIRLQNLEPGVHVMNLSAIDLAGNEVKKEIRFKVTKILPDPIKKIVKKDQSEEKKTNESKKSSKIYLWMMIGMMVTGTSAVLIYKKVQKYRKYERS